MYFMKMSFVTTDTAGIIVAAAAVTAVRFERLFRVTCWQVRVTGVGGRVVAGR